MIEATDMAMGEASPEVAPEISCVIPTYESPALAERCIRAVLAQGQIDIQVVVSDDSKTSVIRELCRVLMDPRVEYVAGAQTDNPVENWNAGLDRARGRYAVVIHHDEFLGDPLYLRRAVDALNAGAAIAVGGVEVQGGSRFALVSSWARRLRLPPWTLYAANWIGPTAAVVFRAAAKTRFDPSLVWVVDVHFYTRLFSRHRDIAWDAAGCVLTARHAAQITTSLDTARLNLEELRRLRRLDSQRFAPWQYALVIALAWLRAARPRP